MSFPSFGGTEKAKGKGKPKRLVTALQGPNVVIPPPILATPSIAVAAQPPDLVPVAVAAPPLDPDPVAVVTQPLAVIVVVDYPLLGLVPGSINLNSQRREPSRGRSPAPKSTQHPTLRKVVEKYGKGDKAAPVASSSRRQITPVRHTQSTRKRQRSEDRMSVQVINKSIEEEEEEDRARKRRKEADRRQGETGGKKLVTKNVKVFCVYYKELNYLTVLLVGLEYREQKVHGTVDSGSLILSDLYTLNNLKGSVTQVSEQGLCNSLGG
ncbi:hypothetical protein K435DRAFT_933391 [Dendrothele bispora CBS 962.96]|uniref:Uncharacterized protein n=1 Tax=Dendrothele bispora (strain CBS 962.96) TaxID=1314807 RepID=A0A4S8L223_DENBC|nr:hypothetical protein K435DRAFT_933391 [Dendrothele bispora CBS 962.96]